MDFHGGILANKPPCYSKICMGEERELNKTCSSGDSCYLYGKIIQVTCPSRYGGDLVKTGLVIARFYCTLDNSSNNRPYLVAQLSLHFPLQILPWLPSTVPPPSETGSNSPSW